MSFHNNNNGGGDGPVSGGGSVPFISAASEFPRNHNSGGGSYTSDDIYDDNDSVSTIRRFRIWNLFSPRWYITTLWNTVHSTTFASIITLVLFWASLFLYITFYFLYIPPLDLSKPIFFQFDSGCFKNCEVPYAEVQLSHYKSPVVFTRGQSYRIQVDLTAPESDVNYHQGMFMIKITLFDSKKQIILSSGRPAILTHRSYPVRLMLTALRSVPLTFGLLKEEEHLSVPLLDDYVDGIKANLGPAVNAKIELIARDIQVYSSHLLVRANLTGLRWYMVHWPFITALFGISTFFAFLSLLTICSVNRASQNSDSDTVAIPYDELSSLSNGAETINGDPNDSLLTSDLRGDIPEDDLPSPDSTTSQ